MKYPISNPQIEQAYASFPENVHEGANRLRDLILTTGAQLADVDNITECLRWGQPSYISPIGTALRIGVPKSGGFGLFTHCQSNVISNFTQTFGPDFRFDGNRGVLFETENDIQPDKLRLMIEHALTYKLKRN
ncbi:hypothetical protein GCM10008927_26370 [Amylibacter ulvae]|uniref:YdhG-like domain-containing protein n=2 Tax=Paramylibacter ulvae TaxID=1651968 RepID=A0ABQ3D5A4_9RHOB|nr:hypothetical protein GCM10008927_26370 [Amylibacter ulvae]